MLTKISEDKDIIKYLNKRNLLSQYKKIKNNLLNSENIYKELKKRKPKKDDIYQFKINKQYRAYCVFNKHNKNTLVVFEINNHQN